MFGPRKQSDKIEDEDGHNFDGQILVHYPFIFFVYKLTSELVHCLVIFYM